MMRPLRVPHIRHPAACDRTSQYNIDQVAVVSVCVCRSIFQFLQKFIQNFATP